MNEYLKKFLVSLHLDKESLQNFSKDLKKTVTLSFRNASQEVAKNIGNAITSAFTNAWKELSNILNFSQLSSSKTRELAFGYGFGPGEAYAWEKALGAVGLKNEEDLFYANQQELAQFREAFEKYSNKYDELYDSGFFETMQEYQFEMADFKNEMQLEIVEFFMNNKELIKSGMKAVMTMAEVLLEMFGWLVRAFGNTNEALSTSDVISQYSEVKNNSNSVSVNNNFNGVGKSDEQWLSDMGQLTYAQVIEALGG